jgi:hypothetical protein
MQCRLAVLSSLSDLTEILDVRGGGFFTFVIGRGRVHRKTCSMSGFYIFCCFLLKRSGKAFKLRPSLRQFFDSFR